MDAVTLQALQSILPAAGTGTSSMLIHPTIAGGYTSSTGQSLVRSGQGLMNSVTGETFNPYLNGGSISSSGAQLQRWMGGFRSPGTGATVQRFAGGLIDQQGSTMTKFGQGLMTNMKSSLSNQL